MAHKRKVVPPDPPAIVAVRERRRPADFSKVGRSAEFDQQWHLKWVHQWKLDLARGKGYTPVKPSEVDVPAAYGDKTKKGMVCHQDLILCKCARDEYDRRKKEDADFARFELEGRAALLREQADAAGIDLKQKLSIGKPLKGADAEQFVTIGE